MKVLVAFLSVLFFAKCSAQINWDNILSAKLSHVFVKQGPAGDPSDNIENVAQMNSQKQALHAHEVLLVSETRQIKGQFIGCVGALITTQHVLAAANCVFGMRKFPSTSWPSYDTPNVNIFFGVKTLDEAKLPTAVKRTVDRDGQDIERGYNPVNSGDPGNDLVMLKLNSPVDLVPNKIETINLPDDILCKKNFEGETVTISGWEVNDEEYLMNNLKSAEVKIKSSQDCNIFNGYYFRRICASDITSRNVCKEALGGPLVYKDKASNKNYLLGMRSYGGGDCNVGAPVVYSTLCLERDWIESAIRN